MSEAGLWQVYSNSISNVCSCALLMVIEYDRRTENCVLRRTNGIFASLGFSFTRGIGTLVAWEPLIKEALMLFSWSCRTCNRVPLHRPCVIERFRSSIIMAPTFRLRRREGILEGVREFTPSIPKLEEPS